MRSQERPQKFHKEAKPTGHKQQRTAVDSKTSTASGGSTPETYALRVNAISGNRLKTYTPQHQPSTASEFISAYDTYVKAKTGVPATLIQQIQKGLGITMKELAGLLRISESTIHKYKQPTEQIADQGMAEQLILMSSLTEHGNSIFKKPNGFQQWLRSPQWDLNDVPPLAFLSTSQGIVFVNEILGRIEHGLPA